MKKLLSLLMILVVLLTSGCETVSTLLIPEDVNKADSEETEIVIPETEKPKSELDDDGTKNKIAKGTEYKNNNHNTTMFDEYVDITEAESKDRVILATDAQPKDGLMNWSESNYWSLGVLVDGNNDGVPDGVYNLYFGDMSGRIYVEVNEYLIQGIATPVITAYFFGGEKREIREYLYDGKFFVETTSYTTDNFSTGGINNIVTSFPDYVEQP